MFLRVVLTSALMAALVLSVGNGALALEPGEVLVVVNATVSHGAELAAHYMSQRGIPADNIVRVSLPEGETVSRRRYDDAIAVPVRKALASLESRRRIRCLVLKKN